MKNLQNRIRVVFVIICCSVIALFFYGCKNDDTPPNCGCESETQATIPKSANLIGKLFFKNDSTENNYNNQKYWIVYFEEDCGNCVHNLIICDESMLDVVSNISTLTNVSDIIVSVNELKNAIDIKFSGKLKSICNPIYAPADYTYEYIVLTSIEQQ